MPPLSIPPLETLAEMVAWGGDTESDVRGFAVRLA
jgi:hypothetical protein